MHEPSTPDQRTNEIAELRRTLSALQDRLASLEGSVPDARDAVPTTTSRRTMLRLAGATAIGAAATALGTGRVAADTGYQLGGATSVGDVVRQQLNGSRPNEFGFLFATNGFALTSNATDRPAAVGIANFDPAVARGLYAFSISSGGIGIEAQATAGGSIGILSEATGAGLVATATDAGGDGVRGTCEADGGVGVNGRGATGVRGSSSSSAGHGGRFEGPGGALLIDRSFGAPVPTRTIEHRSGSIQRDEFDLWYCIEGGSPGTWRKLAGASTAGSFHAIAPVRVYDSRAAAPTPGALAKGQQRIVSVADGRDLGTGAPTVRDVVPAGATAVAVNLTVTSTVGSGYLSLAPGSAAQLSASSINWWTDGITIANGLVVALDDQRRLKVFCEGSPGCTTDMIVDVQGYWR